LLAARVLGLWLSMAAALVVTEVVLWLIAGLRASVWAPRLFLSVPVILLIVLVYLSLLTLFNMVTGNAALSGLAAFAVMVTSAALRQRGLFQMLSDNPVWQAALRWSYRILPKTGEIANAIHAFFDGSGAVPWFAIWTSTLFAGGAFALAAWLFERK